MSSVRVTPIEEETRKLSPIEEYFKKETEAVQTKEFAEFLEWKSEKKKKKDKKPLGLTAMETFYLMLGVAPTIVLITWYFLGK